MISDHLFEFWLMPEDWPRDTASHIFLARALDVLGKALFPDSWMGVPDIVSKPPPPLPISMRHADVGVKNRAYDLIQKHRPDRGLAPRGKANARELTQDEWTEARNLLSEQQAAQRASVSRMKGVERALVDGAESGALLTAYRPVKGGQFTDMPTWWWNTEKIANRLCRCQINPSDPFGIGFAGDGFCLIFVERESFGTLIDGLRKDPESSADSHQDNSPLAEVEFYELVSLPGKKQQAVFSAIKSVWSDGRVPRLLSIADIEKKISPIIKLMGDPGGASTDNIRRSLGLKK